MGILDTVISALEATRDCVSRVKEKIQARIKTVVDKSRKWVEKATAHVKEKAPEDSLGTKIGVFLGTFLSSKLEKWGDKLTLAIYGEQIKRGEKTLPVEEPDIRVALDNALLLKETFKTTNRNEIQQKLAAMSKAQRVGVMADLAAKAAKLMGVDTTAKITELDYTLRGAFVDRTNTIVINERYLEDWNSDRAINTIDTIIHELTHARQWASIVGKDLGYSKGRVREYVKNWRWYFNGGSDERYWKQPIEADSQRMVSLTWEALARAYENERA